MRDIFSKRLKCFKGNVLDGTFRKVKYHATGIAFQARGSLHVHSLLWIMDALVLNKYNIDEYINFVEDIVKITVVGISKNVEFYNLVTTYQIHAHLKSC